MNSKHIKWIQSLFWGGIMALGLLWLFEHPRPVLPIGEGESRKSNSGRSFANQLTLSTTPQLGPSGFDDERVWSIYDDWEPAVADDPTSPYVYQLTTRYDGPPPCLTCQLPAIIFRRSSDGGATWEADQFLLSTRLTVNDPQIEVANDGTIYVAVLNEYMPGVKFMKSSDHGQSWSQPIRFTRPGTTPEWSDRPILAISPDGQDVYVAFNASDSYVVASHDYGQSFSAPVRTNNDSRYWFHSAGAVAPNGHVYFATADYSQDYSGSIAISLIRSTDGGQSWTTHRVERSAEMPDCPWADGCYFGFLGPSVGLAVDPAGTILIAYNASQIPAAPQKMIVRRSTDGGLSWTPRLIVSGNLAHNGFPAVAAGPTAGDFRLVWQGSTAGQTDAWNSWYRHTSDGGLTWEVPIRLSNLTDGAPYKDSDGYFFPYGDYLEISVDGNGLNHIIWGAGHSYVGPGGTWYSRGP